jgi:hypothetical protein
MREGDLAAGLFCAAIGVPFILLLWILERVCIRLLRRAWVGKPNELDPPPAD